MSVATHPSVRQLRLPTLLAFMLAATLLASAGMSVLSPTVASAQQIDVNEADADTLAALPGIGKTTAKLIVKYRDDNGPFSGPNDLLKVRGIGKKTLDKLSEKLVFGGTEEDAAAEAGSGGDAGAVNAEGGPSLQRGNRMEFDGRLIRGETAGAGAVFLFERVPRPLPSMVKKRTSYLDDTITATYGEQDEVYEESEDDDAPGPGSTAPADEETSDASGGDKMKADDGKKKGGRSRKMRRGSGKMKR